MYVSNVWSEVVDEAGGDRVDRRIPVGLLEIAGLLKRVVHPGDGESVPVLGSHAVLGGRRIRLPGQHEDVVAKESMQRAGMGVRVDFAAALRPRRKRMNDDKNLH